MIRSMVRTLVKRPYVWLRNTTETLLFERRYGVKTAGEVTLEELGVAGKDRQLYLPSGIMRLRRILPRREVTDRDVFLDIGSGMGRVVLQAALHYPFARVIGVELSDQLNDVARQNLERNRDRLRCRDVSLINADALEYEIPDDVTVVYIYNSFQGATFKAVLDDLLASVDRNPRMVRIIYSNPVEEQQLLATGRIRLVRVLRGWRPTESWSRSNSVRMFAIDPPSTAA